MFAPRTGVPLAAAALALVAGGAAVALRLLPASGPLIAAFAIAVGLWAFLAAFFRDPERPVGEGVVSAADGRVREVRVAGDELLVSVFMNVTDVHVNRLPWDGRFVDVGTGGAGHRAAYRPDADRNVARSYRLETELGPVRLVQITGVVARRLVSFVRAGEARRKGERFGMIVLGSRVDVYLPAARVEPLVRVGERVVAGRTPIARVRR